MGGALTARMMYGSLLDSHQDDTRAPRRDNSKATVVLKRVDTVKDVSQKISPQHVHGESSLHEVDGETFALFLKEQRDLLSVAKEQGREATQRRLAKQLELAMEDASNRVASFADWYFAYTTTYRLLSIAMTSAAIKKRYGERGHPCLIPLCSRNVSDVCPLLITTLLMLL